MPPSVQQLYDPAQAFTGRATGTIPERALVAVAATKVDGDNVPIKVCGASDAPIGAIGPALTTGDIGAVYGGGVQLVPASGTVTFGQPVQPAANGAVATLSTGRKCGVALADAAGGLVLVQIQL